MAKAGLAVAGDAGGSVVMKPQAMNAPMFGMTMPLRNRPNAWIRVRALLRATAGATTVDDAKMNTPSFGLVSHRLAMGRGMLPHR
ncbi:hypothetical protein [Thermaerobacter marianensis]|uniref:hypothetical protein n=1 Tax=Thermaerobacter marianensis TaxID=73919 RepID=UPI00145D3C34|nr:hypothetical protein [Thermaerobacter marianensis]